MLKSGQFAPGQGASLDAINGLSSVGGLSAEALKKMTLPELETMLQSKLDRYKTETLKLRDEIDIKKAMASE